MKLKEAMTKPALRKALQNHWNTVGPKLLEALKKYQESTHIYYDDYGNEIGLCVHCGMSELNAHDSNCPVTIGQKAIEEAEEVKT